MGHPFPTKLRLPMVPWAYQSPQPKRYLDRFSRLCALHFAGLTSVTDRQTTLLGR